MLDSGNNDTKGSDSSSTTREQISAGSAGGPPSNSSQGAKATASSLFFMVSLDMLALGMIAPNLPRLVENFLHGDIAAAARMLGIFGTVFAAMRFLFSPVIGSLSDRFGRRPILLLSIIGRGFDYLLMAWAPVLGWLFLGRIISGLTSSSTPTAKAYIADVTSKEKRASAFAMLNVFFGIGFVLGPAIGGLLGSVHPRLPFWVAAGLSLINGLYGIFVLPESLSPQGRSAFSWRRANPVGSLALLRRGSVFYIATVLLLSFIARQSLANVYVLYVDYRYQWSMRTIGLSLAVIGVFIALYGGLFVKPIVAKLGERGAMIIGLLGGALGYAIFGLSRRGVLFWFGIPLLTMMSFAWVAAQSILSHKAGPSEQGPLQGAINSLRGIAGLIGPALFTAIFSESIGPDALIYLPGSAFYLAALLLLVSLVLMLMQLSEASRQNQDSR